MLARVLDARGARPAPRQLRFVLLGGGPCPAPLLSRARDAGFPVAPTYGLTEATSQVATRAPDAPQDAGLAPLPGTEVRIADEAGRWLPPGREGEICVRGPSLMTGYWRRPEATAAALRDGWLHTGDIGRLDAARGLHVLDRRSDLIVSGGENVYPAEVEAVLLAHPAVAEAGVAAVADATWGARPAAWWVARPGAEADADTLARFCRERLAGYKVPVAYRRVASLPRTAAGKLRRHALAGDPSADLV
jgi:O-succinylbenzoic acid--CoA ligase